ncbi:MAG: SbcC/MukB-like Walker B domain-containing protein, partial [Pseudomonadota bacterium]|nr:SbcC/MukB-like Walker B domain-containing protein [Pseudomonadota bacterium]
QFEQAQQALQQHRTQYGDDLVLQRRVVELHQQKDSTQAQIGQLKDYQQYCQQQDQRQQQLDDLQAEAKQLQQQIEQQQTALQQIEQCVEYSRIEQQSLTKQLQRQRMIQQQSATDLRAVLQPEQPCPVCGSTAHPYAGDLVDSAQLSLAERLLQDSEQQLQQLIEQWQQQQQQQVQQQIALQHLQYALTQCDHSQHSLSEQLAAHAQKKKPLQLQLVAQYGAEQLSQIDALLAQQVANLLPLEQQIEQVIEQQNAREQYRSQLEQAKQMLEQSTLKTTNMQQQIQQASQSAEWASQQFLPQLPAEWQHEWQQAVAQLPVQPVLLSERVAQWQSSIKARRQQLDRRQHIRESVATLQQQLDVMQVVQHNQQQVCSEQQQRLTERQASIDRLTQQIQQILPPDVASVSTWQRQLEQHTTQLTQQQHMSQQQQQQAMQQQQVTQQRIDMQQQRLAECKQERDECAARVLACLQQQPDLSREQLEQLMAITDQQLQQMQQHVQQRQRVLDQADARLEQWQQQMLTHHTQRPTHAQADLIRAYQQQQVDLKNAQEQRAATVAMLQADTEQRQRYQALAQQIVQAETEHQRWAKLAAPIGCATGATFRKIAQGYQLDSLLFYANQQLELFSPRYRLQRAPSSLGLLVIDADLADERRAVHSLSGGESFLVSLALALALAQMASGQMQIESLFIDEGFGSLDPESLQVVMDALDQLQGQGRKVAVITHVQEMQERIPVQIRVERRGSGRSVLRVLG